GADSLLSIMQMPAGVPVATVAIDNSTNAGLLAVEILGTGDAGLRQKLTEYKQGLEQKVMDKVARLDAAKS
ncbi:MAG: AIR carboxylase family protein, partial [Gammaproteobacteria bacterium]